MGLGLNGFHHRTANYRRMQCPIGSGGPTDENGIFVAYNNTMKSEDLTTSFVTYVVRPHEIPTDIISNRGSLFKSQFWEQVTKAFGISQKLSMAFHPQTDGQIERVNATLEQYLLRAYCN
jgi:transposase InsO family protein